MKINGMYMNTEDNVVTSLQQLEKNEEISYYFNDGIERISLIEDIPKYHKVALKDVDEGDFIFKYGEVIGVTMEPIKKGQHVSHLNIESVPRDYNKETEMLKEA